MNQSHKKPGRPKREAIDTLEITLAKNYQAYMTLGEQFIKELERQYPGLNSDKKVQLKHLIYSVAEEHRLWSDIDNLLLSVQRHKKPNHQYDEVRDNLLIAFTQLKSIYSLILKTELITNTLALPRLEQQFNIGDNNMTTSHWVKSDLHKVSAYEQAKWFSLMCDDLQVSLNNDVANSDLILDQIKNIRLIIRAILLSLSTFKIEPLFRSQTQRSAGRPTLPLPTQLLRLEDLLLNSYRSYRLACQRLHRQSLNSHQVWELHKSSIESKSLGRKAMSPLRALINQQLSLETELYCLTKDKDHIIKEINRKNERKTSAKGRPALTYDQRLTKVEQQLHEVNSLIKQHEIIFSSEDNHDVSFAQQTLQFKRVWLQNKLKHHLNKNEQVKSKSSNACHYWSTSLKKMTDIDDSSK